MVVGVTGSNNRYLNFTSRYLTSPNQLLTLTCHADEHHIHAFEQIRGVLTVIGESGHRKTPAYYDDRTEIDFTLRNINLQADSKWVFSGLPQDPRAADTTNDDEGAGRHAVHVGDVVYAEGFTVDDGGDLTQSDLDTHLNGRFHKVLSMGATSIILDSQLPSLPGTTVAQQITAGNIYKTRNNSSDTYPTPNPISPFEPNPYLRIDDPPALTSWSVREGLSLDTPTARCWPAWVANRQRDWGDQAELNVVNATLAITPGVTPIQANYFDGLRLPGQASFTPHVAWSRRRQKSLPYRVNPEVAGDRIVLAAPGYGCCFQIPMNVPIDPEGWPSPVGSWGGTSGDSVANKAPGGMRWFGNDVFDKPRALGIPKGVIIDSYFGDAALPSPPGTAGIPKNSVQNESPWNFNTYVPVDSQWSPVTTTPYVFGQAGVYKLAISYVDEATGEEGLASEPIEVTIDNANETGVRLLVMHPGYVMGESLCFRINVYMSEPNGEVMGFYTTLHMYDIDERWVTRQRSSKYGSFSGINQSPDVGSAPYAPSASPDNGVLHTRVNLPYLGNPISNHIDFSRLAPASGLMPRGAEAARWIRGQLFTVGHSGTHGNVGETRLVKVTMDYHPTDTNVAAFTPNEIQVRGYRSDMVPTATPAFNNADTATDGGFGIAGNYFPSAYQGIELFCSRCGRSTAAAVHHRLHQEPAGRPVVPRHYHSRSL